MTRREFPNRIKLAAWERCGGFCESCTAKLYPGKTHYDHQTPDALGGEPTLENARVVCVACHSAKTAKRDIPAIAKSRRVRAKHVGGKRPSKFAGWRKMNGEVVHRTTSTG